MAEGDDGNGGAQQLNPLETAQLTQIEVLCEKLYTTASMDERLQADKDLESLFRVDGDRLQPEASMQGGIAAMTAASDFRVIGKHEFLLSKSESNYAIHFSSSALLTIVRAPHESQNCTNPGKDCIFTVTDSLLTYRIYHFQNAFSR